MCLWLYELVGNELSDFIFPYLIENYFCVLVGEIYHEGCSLPAVGCVFHPPFLFKQIVQGCSQVWLGSHYKAELFLHSSFVPIIFLSAAGILSVLHHRNRDRDLIVFFQLCLLWASPPWSPTGSQWCWASELASRSCPLHYECGLIQSRLQSFSQKKNLRPSIMGHQLCS